MSDFECHPKGTAARIAELEAGRVNPEVVKELVEAARAVVRESAAKLLHGDDYFNREHRRAAARLAVALAALEQEQSNPSITARTVATEQGVASEVEYVNENGVVVGYWAYGHFDTRYPYQGEQEQSGGEHD